jgi:kynurenine formamidase
MNHWSGGHFDTTLAVSMSGPVRIYDLAVALHAGMPRHPLHPPFAFAMAKRHNQSKHGDGVSSAMELLAMGAHVGSHVDAFGHVARDGRIFEDRDVLEGENASTGLAVGGIEETPPLIGPGHLVDAEKLFGRYPDPTDGIGPAQFESWFANRAQPGPGSIVLIRTGWMRFWSDSEAYIGLGTGLPGVNLAGARWLSDRGIIATGSDTMNYEHKPDGSIVSLAVHIHNLVENGIPIMESLDLENIAAAGVEDFTFFAAPLRVVGGTGSPIRPLAIVPRTVDAPRAP